MSVPVHTYGQWLAELKQRIHGAQYAALRAVNKELIVLYWDIGKTIYKRQETEGWGKRVVERLSADLKAEFGEKSGFSAQNLWYMRQFYSEYKDLPNLQPLAGEISWTKHTVILAKCKAPLERKFSSFPRFAWECRPGSSASRLPSGIILCSAKRDAERLRMQLADLNRDAVVLAAKIQENFEGLGI